MGDLHLLNWVRLVVFASVTVDDRHHGPHRGASDGWPVMRHAFLRCLKLA
jgi:hypothetical protein